VADRRRPEAGRRGSPPLWARLLVLLLVVSLTIVYSYAGCQQMRHRCMGQAGQERIEAVEAIRAYVERVERALEGAEATEGREQSGGSRPMREDR